MSPSLILPEMIQIEGGSFLMGSDRGQEDERPCHRVEIPAFRIARFSVTNREYEAFLKDTCSPPPHVWCAPGFSEPEQPVVAVNWFEAEVYCRWLSELTRRSFRLPTEAEREFACRGGTMTAFPWGDSPDRELDGYGGRWIKGYPEQVGGPQNAYGLCNMADNLHEWCADWYSADYYRVSAVQNPAGPADGRRRVSRGGSWRHRVKVTRSSARSSLNPEFRYTDYGFRVAESIWDKR